MRASRFIGFFSAATALCSCGGDGGSRVTNPGSGTSYSFVTPVAGAMRTYSETVVDNSSNTIVISTIDTIEGVNTDGTYSEMAESTGGTDAVNGTVYAVPLEDLNLTASGQTLNYSYTSAAGALISCDDNPYGSGPTFPVQVGETWTSNFTLTCGTDAPVRYTQQGTVVDVEEISVPAGTFSALKLVSTVTWTNAQGTTRTESLTNWRDVQTSYSVKESIQISYSGTLPTAGYAVSRETELQSMSGGS